PAPDPVDQPRDQQQDGDQCGEYQQGKDKLPILGVEKEVHDSPPDVRFDTGRRTGPGAGVRPARRSPQSGGQGCALVVRASSALIEPSIHLVIADQNDPAPTEEGIMSEASKRTTALSSCISCSVSFSTSEEAFSGSTFRFGLTTPPRDTREFAQCPEAR